MVSVTASLPASLDGMVANVRQLCPHERIEFFEKLLRDCSFMEIRFVASLVESILSANYGCLGSVEDELPMLLGNSEKLLAFGDKLHLDDQRRQLIIILCLLKSRERLEVTKVITDIFQKLPNAVRKMSSTSSLTVLAAHEILLLFSLAMCHPAFEFSQKYNFYTALQSVVGLLQPALGDGDKESCILLKSSFSDLVAPNVVANCDKLETTKPFKISQDEDIAFIQVDIPVTSSPNGPHATNELKSLTVKTEKLVNVYAEKCVQQPSNPKTDPNAVLLKSKDGSRESVLQSALSAIVSDGGLTKLLEIFPQDAKAQLAEERMRRTTVKQQDAIDVGNSCSPDSDFIINENNSPDNSCGQSGHISGNSSSSLRGSTSFDKKSAKSESSRSVGSCNASSGVASALSNSDPNRDGRKLAPSAPPSLTCSSTHSDDSPSSGSSSCDWNGGLVSSKNTVGKLHKADDISSTSSGDGSFAAKQPAPCSTQPMADLAVTTGDHGVSAGKSGGRLPSYDFLPHLQPVHAADPKALAMYLQYAQAYQTAAMLGIHPPPASHIMWPAPHMLDPLAHHPPHSPFIVPYPIPPQQSQLEHHLICSNNNNNNNNNNSSNNNNNSNYNNRTLLNNRSTQGTPVQSSTPTPAAVPVVTATTTSANAATTKDPVQTNVNASDTSDKVTTTTTSCPTEQQPQIPPTITVSSGTPSAPMSSSESNTSSQTDSKQKDEGAQTVAISLETNVSLAANDTPSPSGSTSSVNGVVSVSSSTLTSSTSTTVSASQTSAAYSRPVAPYPHQPMPHHPLQMTSTGPMGMSLPNLFTAPLQFVPYSQPTSQVPVNPQSNAGSRRGSVASESGSIQGEHSHFPTYFLYPPVITAPNGASHLQHPSNVATSTPSSSAYIGPRNNAIPMPLFTNPPPPLPGIYHQSTSHAALAASSRKIPVTLPSQVTVHSVSPAQLFSIPPPPLPVTVTQKPSGNNQNATTNSNANTAVPHQVANGNVGPVPVPFIALSNRDLHHALAFPAAFIAQSHVDSFSPPPPPCPPSPNHVNSNSNTATNGTAPSNLAGFRGNTEGLRNHGPFSGQHGGLPGSRRAPVTGFTNVHYHQRINNQQNVGHLHQSQSMTSMPVRPQPNVSRGQTINCFRCGEPGHLQHQCSTSNRRRTPYSGREFHINPVPLSGANNYSESQQPDLRVPLSQFVQRPPQQQSLSSATTGESAKSAPTASQPQLPHSQPQSRQSSTSTTTTTASGKTEASEPSLQSVLVTSDSSIVTPNPVAVA